MRWHAHRDLAGHATHAKQVDVKTLDHLRRGHGAVDPCDSPGSRIIHIDPEGARPDLVEMVDAIRFRSHRLLGAQAALATGHPHLNACTRDRNGPTGKIDENPAGDRPRRREIDRQVFRRAFVG